jgi:hypothetical protein
MQAAQALVVWSGFQPWQGVTGSVNGRRLIMWSLVPNGAASTHFITGNLDNRSSVTSWHQLPLHPGLGDQRRNNQVNELASHFTNDNTNRSGLPYFLYFFLLLIRADLIVIYLQHKADARSRLHQTRANLGI